MRCPCLICARSESSHCNVAMSGAETSSACGMMASVTYSQQGRERTNGAAFRTFTPVTLRRLYNSDDRSTPGQLPQMSALTISETCQKEKFAVTFYSDRLLRCPHDS